MTNTTTAPTVRIVWTRDMLFDVYHDAALVEKIWMDNDGRWFLRKIDSAAIERLAECKLVAEARDAAWAASQGDWIAEVGAS